MAQSFIYLRHPLWFALNQRTVGRIPARPTTSVELPIISSPPGSLCPQKRARLAETQNLFLRQRQDDLPLGRANRLHGQSEACAQKLHPSEAGFPS